MLLICLLTTILQHTNATFLVKLTDTFQSITYSLSNFGVIPYGRTLTGYIDIPYQDAQSNYDLCQLNTDTDFLQKSLTNNWLIIKRGNCTFTQKILNAQLLGAPLAIIVNTDDLPENVIMADDGNGYNVVIPSFIISKSDGNNIINAIQQQHQPIAGYMKFNETQVEVPQVLFGLNIINRESFKLIREFKEYRMKLGDSINFDIYYEILNGPHRINYTGADCIDNQAKYCQLDPDDEGLGNGADVVNEQLRELCLWKQNQNLWWEYMDYFDKNCVAPKEFEDCSYEFMDKNHITSQIKDCKIQGYQYLDQQVDLKYKTGIVYYPGVSLNSKSIRGNIEAKQIMIAICGSMKEQVEACQLQQATFVQDQNQYLSLIIFVVICLSIFICFFVNFFQINVLRYLYTEKELEMKLELRQAKGLVKQYKIMLHYKTQDLSDLYIIYNVIMVQFHYDINIQIYFSHLQ